MKTQRAVSFDESSMESCSLPDNQLNHKISNNDQQQQQQQQYYNKDFEDVQSLEEAKRVIAALRARQRAQAHQMLAWRRTLKLQEELVARLTREKAEQLRSLSSQLLLFESRLCRKQKEIEASLAQREAIILRQQRVIRQLQNKLRLVNEAKGILPQDTTSLLRDSPPCDALDRLDSLGDSDSAVVLEEAFSDDPTPPRFRSNLTDVTLIRSVSDVVEPANSKYSSASRRCNGLLRRPEVLETVYSVEEDGDTDNKNENANDEAEADEEDNVADDNKTHRRQSIDEKKRLRDIYGSFERLAQNDLKQDNRCCETTNVTPIRNNHRTRDDSQQAQVTYNRVMSNHRSVTKPKDVKYKRINKAKSKSLEELRGRLKNWVEKGNKIAISLDQSYA